MAMTLKKAFITSHSLPLFRKSFLALAIMILGMVVIGGLTRLTGSGLSIVEWKPLFGAFPPFTSADWALEFSKYQQSPQFQKVNFGMTLTEFKSIFWLEYIHRLWGRLLGVVLLIPTFLMIFKKQHRELWPLMTLLWLLGFAQGIMGWVMVKSGLIHDPYVSPYRLAAHLFLGFSIFGVTCWMVFIFYSPRIQLSQKNFRVLIKLSCCTLFLVLLTAFLGALVAGLKAGLVYNTFPLMGENFLPYELLSRTPWCQDLLENPVTVQFLHRLFAITTTVFCCGIWIFQWNFDIPSLLSYAFKGVALAALLQLSLGILTLLYQVPLSLAVIHQGFAFILFGSLIYVIFLLYYHT